MAEAREGWEEAADDEQGCDDCRLHWRPGSRDRHGYSVPRAALLLGIGREELEALLKDNPQLQRNELTAPPLLHRVPVHGLASMLS